MSNERILLIKETLPFFGPRVVEYEIYKLEDHLLYKKSIADHLETVDDLSKAIHMLDNLETNSAASLKSYIQERAERQAGRERKEYGGSVKNIIIKQKKYNDDVHTTNLMSRECFKVYERIVQDNDAVKVWVENFNKVVVWTVDGQLNTIEGSSCHSEPFDDNTHANRRLSILYVSGETILNKHRFIYRGQGRNFIYDGEYISLDTNERYRYEHKASKTVEDLSGNEVLLLTPLKSKSPYKVIERANFLKHFQLA